MYTYIYKCCRYAYMYVAKNKVREVKKEIACHELDIAQLLTHARVVTPWRVISRRILSLLRVSDALSVSPRSNLVRDRLF